MTEDSRAAGGTDPFDESVRGQADESLPEQPRDATQDLRRTDQDQHVAGTAFTPPDTPGEPRYAAPDEARHAAPAEPWQAPPAEPWQASPAEPWQAPPADHRHAAPGEPQQPVVPGFVPHHQPPPPGSQAGHGQPDQYGWRPAPAPPPPGGPGGPPGPGIHGSPVGQGFTPNWAPVPPQPGATRRGPGVGMFIVISLVVALVAGGVGASIGVIATRDDDGGEVDLGGSSSTGAKNRDPGTVAGVAKRVLPKVVTIQVASGTGGGASGSGFITKNSYIITNSHVVSAGGGTGDVQIMLNDKKRLPAEVVGKDSKYDIAVLKPKGGVKLPDALELGSSKDVAVGDPVIAVGSPLGLSATVTTGIVSALDRPVQADGGGGEAALINAVQTDAAINPGNSGGPLVDGQGRVVGVNTAIKTIGGGVPGASQGGSIGLGFAIPVDQVNRVARELINKGKVSHPIIGAFMDTKYQGGGARVATEQQGGKSPIVEGGPADKAGLKPGDVITSFDGKPIGAANELIVAIRSKVPGDKVKVSYKRDGKEQSAELTLAESN